MRPVSYWTAIPLTAFVGVLVPVYWAEYGPTNFLWASDIALFGVLIAVWTRSCLLASTMAVGVLLPELGWNVLFLCRLILGPEGAALPNPEYMFDSAIPLYVRALSLYHVALPILLLWLVHRLGYSRGALYAQTLLAWVVLPASYVFTDPSDNINGVYGFGGQPQTWLQGPLYVATLMLLYPLLVYLPTHLLLKRLFAPSRR